MDLIRPHLGATAWLVVGSVATSVALAHAVVATPWLPPERWLLLTSAIGSALFVTAGVYRLAKWRIVRDPHSGLAGCALVLLGLVAIPSRPWIALLASEAEGVFSAAAVRGAVSLIAMGLLVRALQTPRLRGVERPDRLLPSMLVVSAGVLVVAVAVEIALIYPATPGTLAMLLPPMLTTSCWALLAVVMARASTTVAWAGRVAPLLAGMAAAGVLRVIGQEAANVWTIAGTMVAAAMAALATRSAMADLDRAHAATRAVQNHLYEQLGAVTNEVEDFGVWHEDLCHGARNTFAGLKAAMALFGDERTGIRPEVADQLRDAAVIELTQLEEMLVPVASSFHAFDVSGALERAIDPMVALGATIRVTGEPAVGLGRPDDVVLVVRELLIRSFSADPGSLVTLTVGRGHGAPPPGVIVIDLHDDRAPSAVPTLTAEPGLRAARHLMRRQGGELHLLPDGRFGLVLKAAPEVAPGASSRERPDDVRPPVNA